MKSWCLIAVTCIVAAAVLLSCGEVPVFRWNYGKPTSFSFTKSGISPSDVSSDAAQKGSSVKKIDYVDYGNIIEVMLEAADLQSIREANGTLIGTYTPDVFMIPMVKVGFLSSDEGDGFWVILADEGIFGKMEYIDFIRPVYVTSNRRWDNIHYDLLFSEFALSPSDIGGERFAPDIQVHAPGYTDSELPDNEQTADFPSRKYLGGNRFVTRAGELYTNEWDEDRSIHNLIHDPGMLLFREQITKPAIYEVKSDDTVTMDEHREAVFAGNEWELRQPYGPGYPASPCWVDLPFGGLHIGDDTKKLIITASWDLQDIIELWDFGADGMHFQLASDFLNRFTVDVIQVVE